MKEPSLKSEFYYLEAKILQENKKHIVNTYIYIHTYIHTYIHAYIHTYVRTYIHTSPLFHLGFKRVAKDS